MRRLIRIIKLVLRKVNNVFYVGDRDLDIESANNANIKSIFYKPENSYGEPTGEETYIVYDLLEIADLL